MKSLRDTKIYICDTSRTIEFQVSMTSASQGVVSQMHNIARVEYKEI